MRYDVHLYDDPLTHIAMLAERGAHRGRVRRGVGRVFLFWGLSYLLFSVRAHLLWANAPIVSSLRLLCTGTGAVVVGLFAARLASSADGARTVARIVVLTTLTAILLWKAREVYAALFPEPLTKNADNAVWALFWAGYCGAFLSLSALGQKAAA